jgi:hypothetical protein
MFEYETYTEVRERIPCFIEEVYNKKDCIPPWDICPQKNLKIQIIKK